MSGARWNWRMMRRAKWIEPEDTIVAPRNREAKRRRAAGEVVPKPRNKVKRFRGVNVLGQELPNPMLVASSMAKVPRHIGNQTLRMVFPAAHRSEADITREINAAWRVYLEEQRIPAKMVSLRKMLRRAFAAGYRKGLK
jgi:hypothetical protein